MQNVGEDSVVDEDQESRSGLARDLRQGGRKVVQAVMACTRKVVIRSLGFAPGFQVVMRLTPMDVRGG